MRTVEPYRRQIICQLPADPHRLTITQQKRYCSRCPYGAAMYQTLLTPSPVTSPGALSFSHV